MKTLTTILFTVTVALAGCGREKSQAPATGSAAEPAAPAGSAAEPAGSAAAPEEAAAVEDEVEVPTEVDFEEDASQAITDKNLEDHVKAYEDELAQQ